MNSATKRLLAEAKRLPKRERKLFADELCATLESPPVHRSQGELRRILEHRTQELREGKVRALSWSQVKKRAGWQSREKR